MKTITLPFSKVSNPATFEQVEKLRSFDKFVCNVSGSQLMKRLDSADADEAIDALEAGKSVSVNG